MKKLAGIDIGGTKCAVLFGEEKNEGVEIQSRTAFPTKEYPSPKLAIKKFCELLDKDEFDSIGISCGGPLNSKTGVILSPPNLPGWDNVEIAKELANRYNVPCKLQNDANACALAEWKYGAGRGFDSLVFLTFGTGMGAGLILDGKLYEGASGLAGEVGHLRLGSFGPVGFGKAGSFEGFCSGGGIAQLARIRVLEKLQMGIAVDFCGDINSITAADVAKAAFRGNTLAREIYSECGHYLGLGLSLIIDMLNPQAIIMGSIYERSGQLLFDSMMKSIESEALLQSRLDCKILGAELSDKIGDYAALACAL